MTGDEGNGREHGRAWVGAAGGLLALAVAVTSALVGAPTVLRSLVALPMVVLVAGRALTALLLRPDGGRRPGDVLGVAAPLLLGVVAALGSVLLLGLVLHPVLGVRLSTTSLVLAAGAVAAVLHLAATRRRTRSSWRRAWRGRRVGLLVRGVVLPALAAVVLLVVGVAGARALLVPRVERYTQLTLLDPTPYRQGGLVAAPGARVTVAWVLRGYGEPLPDPPPVSLTVAGSPALDLRARDDAAPADVTGATAARAGTVSAAAPQAAGLYRVALTVGDAGTAQTLYLVLEVRS